MWLGSSIGLRKVKLELRFSSVLKNWGRPSGFVFGGVRVCLWCVRAVARSRVPGTDSRVAHSRWAQQAESCPWPRPRPSGCALMARASQQLCTATGDVRLARLCCARGRTEPPRSLQWCRDLRNYSWAKHLKHFSGCLPVWMYLVEDEKIGGAGGLLPEAGASRRL